MTTATTPALSVVIPTYNNRRLLRRCLESVSRQTLSPISVTVVDDASTDSTADLVKSAFPTVRLVSLEANVGFARAVNLGLTTVTTPYVALVNDDVVVARQWAAAGVSALSSEPRLGSVASLILQQQMSDRIDSAGDLYSIAGGSHCRGRGQRWEDEAPASVNVFSACAAAAFYRMSALQQVGFLDGDLEAFYDDIDLGFRLRLAGFECRLVPAARCWHVRGASYGRGGFRPWYLSSRNSELVFWSNMPLSLLPMSLPRRMGYLMLQFCQRLLQGGALPWILGKCSLLKDIQHLRSRRSRIQLLRVVPDSAIQAALTRRWFQLHVLSTVKWRWADSQATQGSVLGKRSRISGDTDETDGACFLPRPDAGGQ